METYLWAALCWGLGGFVNGIAGFGAALVAMPLVTQWVDLVYAVPSCTIIALSMNVQVGLTYRRDADWKRLRPLIIGAFPGAVAGATVLSHMPEDKIKVVMGAFLLLYSAWNLFGSIERKGGISPRWGYLAGFGTSAIGMAFGMGGPPSIIYMAMAGWTKDIVKAGLACFFGVSGVIMFVVQIAYGLQTVTSFKYFLVCAPAIAVGTRLGIITSRHIGEKSYRKIVFILLMGMGGMILFRSLPKIIS